MLFFKSILEASIKKGLKKRDFFLYGDINDTSKLYEIFDCKKCLLTVTVDNVEQININNSRIESKKSHKYLCSKENNLDVYVNVQGTLGYERYNIIYYIKRIFLGGVLEKIENRINIIFIKLSPILFEDRFSEHRKIVNYIKKKPENKIGKWDLIVGKKSYKFKGLSKEEMLNIIHRKNQILEELKGIGILEEDEKYYRYIPSKYFEFVRSTPGRLISIIAFILTTLVALFSALFTEPFTLLRK